MQEISALKDTINIGVSSTDRSITKRSAKTSVIVKDQETVAIGGLISEIERESETRVPLLGDLPLLGYLFRSKTMKREKTNLILLLTPKVIKDGRDLDDVTQKQRARFKEAAQKADPVDIPEMIGTRPAAGAAAPQERGEIALSDSMRNDTV